jgi:hypothetical protein
LFCATANRKVIPTRVRNMSLGNPAMMSSVFWSATSVPTRKAARTGRHRQTPVPMAVVTDTNAHPTARRRS